MATECLAQECEFVEVDWMDMSIEAVDEEEEGAHIKAEVWKDWS